MSNTEWRKTVLDSIQSYFEYKKSSAHANLQNYLNNPAGIGEHGDLVSECIKLVEDIEHAESCLNCVDEMDKE